MIPKHRRNFLPTFVINVILWGFLIFIVAKLSPEKTLNLPLLTLNLTFSYNILLFFLVLTLTLTLTLALIFGNSRRGFFLALFVDGWLILRLFKQAGWPNLILLSAILFTLELYFFRKSADR